MRLAPAAATASRSGLTSSLPHASQASAVLCCALITLLCALPAFSQTDNPASMTADELYQKADTLYKAGDIAGVWTDVWTSDRASPPDASARRGGEEWTAPEVPPEGAP